MYKTPTILLISTFAMTTFSSAQYFTGADVSDQNFSTSGNWSDGVVPSSGNINIGVDGTDLSTPAVIDAGFGVVNLSNAAIHSTTGGGVGMAYAEIAAGGTLRASSVGVGNANNQWYDGTLTIRSGGSVETSANNGGVFAVGGGDVGEVGVLLIEDGAYIEHTKMTLGTYGEITFEFGANSVSTFNTVKNNAGGTNLLDGLIQVDLNALASTGSYTLINSNNSDLLLSGKLIEDLMSVGGTITSSEQSSSFNVLNGGSFDWNLTTVDGGQDLIFNVTSIPEPSMYACLFGFGSIILVLSRYGRL